MAQERISKPGAKKQAQPAQTPTQTPQERPNISDALKDIATAEARAEELLKRQACDDDDNLICQCGHPSCCWPKHSGADWYDSRTGKHVSSRDRNPKRCC